MALTGNAYLPNFRSLSGMLGLGPVAAVADEAMVGVFGVVENDALYRSKGVKNEKKFIMNSRGMKLFTQCWLPLNNEMKATIFMLHGYGNDISWHFQSTALRFANAGYATFAMDYEGHGRSDGLRAYMENYEDVVDDCVAYAKSIRERTECAGKPCFLYGESLGGGIALLIHKKEPHSWNGAVLVAPMCKISEKIKPPAAVTKMLTWVAPLAPTLAVVPSKDVLSRSVKDLKKRELAQRNPAGYRGKPRLKTALEFLRMCKFIEQHMHEVNLPFLVLHGDADVVTDPEISKLLHKNAVSSDKTIKIYHGMWHQIMTGEPDENVEMVFTDISEWLDQRVNLASAWKKDLPDD